MVICVMDGASFITKMEAIMKALGRIIKWTAMESSTMKVANLPTKAIGLRTNSMV